MNSHSLPRRPTRVDCHMHTPLCGHASGLPREYVDAAHKKGLHLITFTCHIPMQDPAFRHQGVRMLSEELPLYREMVADAKSYGQQLGIEVLCGIEAEVHPDPAAMAPMDAFLAREKFDFVLGSLHHMLPAYLSWLAHEGILSDEAIVRAYFDCLGKAAKSRRYDSLAHPDVIRMYGTLKRAFHPAAYEAAIIPFLDAVAESGVCLEINTSGLTKGDYTVHPDPLIMEWALQRKIPFTIGSDSHHPNAVGQFFEEVIPLFKSIGLDRLHFFRNRVRHEIRL